MDGRDAMRWPRTAGFLALAPLVGLGCAAPQKGGVVPFGQWVGEGEVVIASWPAPATATRPATGPADPELERRRYTTWLHIRPLRTGGRDVIDIEIRSKSGLVDGGDVHLRVGLDEARRLSDSTVVYRVDTDFDPASEVDSYDFERSPPYGATCTTLGNRTTLVIQYHRPFLVDVLRFEGDSVEKTGTYPDSRDDDGRESSAFIHWTERLKRIPGTTP